MKIIVKKLLGEECVIPILPTETVLELKHKVSKLFKVEVPQQRLIFKGRTLADENPLSFYPRIKNGSKLNLLVMQKSDEGSSKGKTSGLYNDACLLREEISRVLLHYYTVAETDRIVTEIMNDLRSKVNNLSYDDLERLATAIHQDQENLA